MLAISQSTGNVLVVKDAWKIVNKCSSKKKLSFLKINVVILSVSELWLFLVCVGMLLQLVW